ncbi:hypothetical protein [Erwinia pyrifoliae]|uniref:hypothetical protein n=1 Tax=Erwinia pyrifoliae TaxID=79967 RepID=UPI00223BD7E3|nr:hypothetical protein [Erwinia pyrifoliae]MCT2388644.1 hypothetical protein [Erwinia pyrifoliae]MCU8586813.1 hypothetical protein [Erwinia pyrifoliae]
MFTPIKLQPPHGNDISGWMSQSSRAVPHDSVLNRISGVQNGPVHLLPANDYMKTVQDGKLLINNLASVKPAEAAQSSSSHPSQPEIYRRQRYYPKFVEIIKQELLTKTVRQVAEQYGLPYQTVYKWANKPDGAIEKIKCDNISEIAIQSRFHLLSELRKHCIDRVKHLCSERQNLRWISKREIIIQVAEEEDIKITTVSNWVARGRKYSSDSRRVSQLPKRTPYERHSVKNVQTHQSVNRNSYAHQLNAQNNIGSVELWANESSTAPPTVRTDSTNDEKNAKSFAECLQELKEWQDKHLCRM